MESPNVALVEANNSYLPLPPPHMRRKIATGYLCAYLDVLIVVHHYTRHLFIPGQRKEL